MRRTRYLKLLRIVPALIMLSAFPFGFSPAAEPEKRPILFAGLSATNNDPGWLFKLDTAGGYRFNRHFEIIAGLPVYFVRAPEDTLEDGFSSKAGIGNFYLDFRVMAEITDFYISSSLRGAAPTGDEEDGFSSGRVTVDWNNYFEYSAGKWAPFISAGIANSISDTHFFTRPFTSLGIVGQFEGGLLFNPAWWLGLGGSGYAVIPAGEQKIYSRVSGRRGTQSDSMGAGGYGNGWQGGAALEEPYTIDSTGDIARDHGFSCWVDIYPFSDVALEFGYSRSVSYEYNTLSLSARFDLAGMIRNDRD